MLVTRPDAVLGNIAVDVECALARRAASGAPGRTVATRLASGDDWRADDVICTSGPGDRSFEEAHRGVSIALVIAGTFDYRSTSGHAMLTPGSLLLGNDGDSFECGHDHAPGDRCVSFHYAPQFFERIAADAGATPTQRRFRAPRVPPLRPLASVAAHAAAGATSAVDVSWEEIAIETAAAAVRLGQELPPVRAAAQSASVGRVTESVRRIEHDPGTRWTIERLAADAGHSPFHYLRTFQQVTGVTPHQFILRARLRQAAVRLVADDAKVIEVALGAGFGDLSNFNAAFRAEFGMSPRVYRARRGRR